MVCHMRLIRQGFTLIELIVVVSIIAIISAVVFVAVNPGARQLAARNARRTSDVSAIVSALKTYQADTSSGALPSVVNGMTAGQIYLLGTSAGSFCNSTSYAPSGCQGAKGPSAAAVTVAATCGIDLSTPLASYIQKLPVDPAVGTTAFTGYWISRNNSGFVSVGDCTYEGSGATAGG